MPLYLLDSSAVVKLYRHEPGTRWLKGIKGDPGSRIHVARICRPEVVAALTRQQKAGELTSSQARRAISEFEDDLVRRFRIVVTGPQVINEAVRLVRKHGLRGYDGVQLASTMQIHRLRKAAGLPRLTFVSADVALNKAALAEGMAVEDPNQHT